MAYLNRGIGSSADTAVVRETLCFAGRELEWQAFASFEMEDGGWVEKRTGDVLFVPLKARSAASHATTFVSRPVACASCDRNAHFIEREAFVQLLQTADFLEFDVTAELWGEGQRSRSCFLRTRDPLLNRLEPGKSATFVCWNARDVERWKDAAEAEGRSFTAIRADCDSGRRAPDQR